MPRRRNIGDPKALHRRWERNHKVNPDVKAFVKKHKKDFEVEAKTLKVDYNPYLIDDQADASTWKVFITNKKTGDSMSVYITIKDPSKNDPTFEKVLQALVNEAYIFLYHGKTAGEFAEALGLSNESPGEQFECRFLHRTAMRQSSELKDVLGKWYGELFPAYEARKQKKEDKEFW